MSSLSEMTAGEVDDLNLGDLSDDKPDVGPENVPGVKLAPYVEKPAVVLRPRDPFPEMFSAPVASAKATTDAKKLLIGVGVLGAIFFLGSLVFGTRRRSLAGSVRLSDAGSLFGTGGKKKRGKKSSVRSNRASTQFDLGGGRVVTVYLKK